MLGPKGSTIISILKVLTPSEIDRYTEEQGFEESDIKVASGAEGFELSSFSHLQTDEQTSAKSAEQSEEVEAQLDEFENEAKIIPINSSIQLEESHLKASGLEALGIESRHSVQERKSRDEEYENSKKESTTVFILNQREQLKESQNKLVSQAAILEYKKSATQEVYNKGDHGSDENRVSTGSSGILINKKHY
jgi:hypothetical protein